MPRPGPRPYECVKRAWHSERHQPMRGSLIQEIFRVVNESHTSATKKNKEWQEKLPVVVLKAEEIMYSKANSEAEYMDVKTLWDRANDAIDTIIRKEEGTETEGLLQPCIEAALILGCTARRSSRSQRNSNPRCYLSPKTQQQSHLPPRIPEIATQKGGSSHLEPPHSVNPTSSSHFMSYPSNIPRSTNVSSTKFGSESCTPSTLDHYSTVNQEVPLSLGNFPRGLDNQIFPATSTSSNLGRVYPLYYGVPHQSIRPQCEYQTPRSSHSNTFVVAPNTQWSAEPSMKGSLQNFFPSHEPQSTSTMLSQADLRNKSENSPQISCDLSLQLGVLSNPCEIARTNLIRGVEDTRPSSSRECFKSGDRPPRIENEFCFFPAKNTDDDLEFCSRKWSSEGNALNLESPSRKRKEPVRISEGEARSSPQPKFCPDLFFGKFKKLDK